MWVEGMRERMILVLGATGTVGMHVLSQLAAGGARVRALARSSQRVDRVRGIASEVVLGDMADIPSLRTAMTDVDHVFLVTPAGPDSEYFTGAVVEAAASLSPHIVRLSTLGADPASTVRLAHWHGRADRLLQRSGLPHTILRPHFFMQNLLREHPATIAAKSRFYAPMKEGAIALVDARDVAAVAAKCLRMPGHAGQSYDITGPEALTFHQVAGHLSEAAGRLIDYVDQSREEAIELLLERGLSQDLAIWLVQLLGVYADGYAGQVTDTVLQVTGHEPTPFSRFAQEYASVWG